MSKTACPPFPCVPCSPDRNFVQATSGQRRPLNQPEELTGLCSWEAQGNTSLCIPSDRLSQRGSRRPQQPKPALSLQPSVPERTAGGVVRRTLTAVLRRGQPLIPKKMYREISPFTRRKHVQGCVLRGAGRALPAEPEVSLTPDSPVLLPLSPPAQ